MGGKKGDTERETLGVKDGRVQEVERGECGGEDGGWSCLITVAAYENDRWNRRKKRQLADAEKRMIDSECSSRRANKESYETSDCFPKKESCAF